VYGFLTRAVFFGLYDATMVACAVAAYKLEGRPSAPGAAVAALAVLTVLLFMLITLPLADFLNACFADGPFVLPRTRISCN
jgi:hypothetical protein